MTDGIWDRERSCVRVTLTLNLQSDGSVTCSADEPGAPGPPVGLAPIVAMAQGARVRSLDAIGAEAVRVGLQALGVTLKNGDLVDAMSSREAHLRERRKEKP